MYRYTVRCEFHGNDSELVQRWLDWLRDPHIADVMRGGARGAEIVKMTADCPTFEIRYQFASREDFDRYQAEFASALREEGLEKFPLEEGLVYSRSDGEVVFSKF